MRVTGFHAQGEDEREPPLDLTRLLIRHPAIAFLAWMSGDAMAGAGIRDGDLLVIEAAEDYRSGQIVLAFVDGAAIVRRLEQGGGQVALLPAHPDFPVLDLGKVENWLIRGRVLAAITPFALPRVESPEVN
jgi:DNA polymerase V